MKIIVAIQQVPERDARIRIDSERKRIDLSDVANPVVDLEGSRRLAWPG